MSDQDTHPHLTADAPQAAPDPSGQDASGGRSLPVDENGIPILEEIIEPDEAAATKSLIQSDIGTLPDPQTVLESLKLQLRTQLQSELGTLLPPVISIAVEQATINLERVVRDELNFSLGKRLEALIEAALQEQFGNQQEPKDQEQRP